MEKMFKSIPITLFFIGIVLFAIPSLAQTIKADDVQYIPEVEVIFSRGINEYRSGRYEIANRTFEELLNEYPNHQRITAVHFMAGKCLYKLDSYRKSLTAFSEFIKNYPTSNYVDDAHFALGKIYYHLGQYNNSLNEFLFVADNSSERKLIETSRNLALKIIDNNIEPEEIQQLQEKSTGETASAILTIKLSQHYSDRGEREKAIALLQEFVRHHPDNPYLSSVQGVLSRVGAAQPVGNIKIGVILPLTGEYAAQARSVLDGIIYAQKKFNSVNSSKVDLVIKDSEGDVVKLVSSARELANDGRVSAIIGELERDKTVVISAITSDFNIPIIAPTTSGSGVASINDYTFQPNCDLETIGTDMARYAVQSLGLKTFATLAPADNYGKDMTDAFTAMVDQLGGQIVAQKWYYVGTEDLKRQFESIRELGFRIMNRDSLVYAMTRDLNDAQRRRFRDDSIPVYSIDGIFIPCYSDEIDYIAPQYAYANIRAQIFGGEYWYDADRLRNNQKYLDGMVFSSSYYKDETSVDYIKFRNDFRMVMKKTPDILEAYGIDAMGVILDAIKNKKTSREEIRRHLDELENYSGIRGPISFRGNNRVNSEIRLIQFKEGKLNPIPR
ncbi:MAG: penicillin-binding protein activator [Candidatus Zhuqueibacterota bacterium]